jgi:hypothetical protein
MLAEAYGKGGQAEEGLRVIAEALAAMHRNAENFYEAELYRLKGELLLQHAVERSATDTAFMGTARAAAGVTHGSPLQTSVETCFRQAIDFARQRHAKSLELRAVMSLSRLWQRQGRREEAHKMLDGIYSWFREGLDTADLQEAKALLEELA